MGGEAGDDAESLRVPPDTYVGNVPSLALAALVGGLFALLAGLPLMRLSGLAAGIATFAVLEITNNVLRYYERIGPGLDVFSSVPETTDMQQAAIGAVVAIGVAFAYQVAGSDGSSVRRGTTRPRPARSGSRCTASG